MSAMAEGSATTAGDVASAQRSTRSLRLLAWEERTRPSPATRLSPETVRRVISAARQIGCTEPVQLSLHALKVGWLTADDFAGTGCGRAPQRDGAVDQLP